MGGALEVGRKDASRDRIQGGTAKSAAMLAIMISQIISTMTHGTLRGPISRKGIAQWRTMNRVGTATTTGVTLMSATGVGTTRPVGTVSTFGMRTLRTLRTTGMRTLRSLRGCHIYLATGNSIRGSRVLGSLMLIKITRDDLFFSVFYPLPFHFYVTF
jgi:hypothetical protein